MYNILLTKAHMKKITESRGPLIDTQQCVRNVGGSRFDMVLIAAARAREIRKDHKNSGSSEHCFSQVSALLDIQSGEVGKEYLLKIR